MSYNTTGEAGKQEKIVQANFVFLCAGPLGSTKILMQSQQRSLEVSDQLGKKFCGNGGLLGRWIYVAYVFPTKDHPVLYISIIKRCKIVVYNYQDLMSLINKLLISFSTWFV